MYIKFDLLIYFYIYEIFKEITEYVKIIIQINIFPIYLIL